MEINVKYRYAASISTLVWALTETQVTGRGCLTGASDKGHFPG